MKVASKCPYCRVPLDENGVVVEGKHDPSCADRELEQSELKRLFARRDRSTSANQWSPWVPVGQDLLRVLEIEVMRGDSGHHLIEDLLSELAALGDMADGNRSVPTDRVRGNGSGVPSFDPAAAERELHAAARRLHDEVLKLSSVVRNPHRSPEPKCLECGRKASSIDGFCSPCGARILASYRRHKAGKR